jgi:hypothetical protein
MDIEPTSLFEKVRRYISRQRRISEFPREGEDEEDTSCAGERKSERTAERKHERGKERNEDLSKGKERKRKKSKENKDRDEGRTIQSHKQREKENNSGSCI